MSAAGGIRGTWAGVRRVATNGQATSGDQRDSGGYTEFVPNAGNTLLCPASRKEVYNMPKPYKVLTIYRESQALPRHHFTDNRYFSTKKGVENRVLEAIKESYVVAITIYRRGSDDMWTNIAIIAPLRYIGAFSFTGHNPLLDSDKVATFFGSDELVEAMREQWPEWVKWEARTKASRERAEQLLSRRAEREKERKVNHAVNKS